MLPLVLMLLLLQQLNGSHEYNFSWKKAFNRFIFGRTNKRHENKMKNKKNLSRIKVQYSVFFSYYFIVRRKFSISSVSFCIAFKHKRLTMYFHAFVSNFSHIIQWKTIENGKKLNFSQIFKVSSSKNVLWSWCGELFNV